MDRSDRSIESHQLCEFYCFEHSVHNFHIPCCRLSKPRINNFIYSHKISSQNSKNISNQQKNKHKEEMNEEQDVFEDEPERKSYQGGLLPPLPTTAPTSTILENKEQPKAPVKRKEPSTTTTTAAVAKKRAKVDKSKEDPPISAYLMLDCMELGETASGKHFARFVKQLPTILGRDNPNRLLDSSFIGLGASTLIGAEHAKLTFNNDTGNYELQVMGKNGVLVRGEKHKGVEGLEVGPAIVLKSKDPVKIGNVGFYICMPETEKPKKPYADMAIEALEARKIHGILQLSSREIAQYIIEKYPYYNYLYGNVDKLNLLAKSCQSAISKCDKIVSVPTGARGRVSYQLGTKAVTSKQPKSTATVNVATMVESTNPTSSLVSTNVVDSPMKSIGSQKND